MKFRMMVIEADEVGREEIAAIAEHFRGVFGRAAAAGGTGGGAPVDALPEAAPAGVTAALPGPVAAVIEPTTARRARKPRGGDESMGETPMAPGTKPFVFRSPRASGPNSSRTAKAATDPATTSQGPVSNVAGNVATPEIIQCRKCGGDLPEGKDRRSPCPRCLVRAWEVIPARSGSPPIAIG